MYSMRWIILIVLTVWALTYTQSVINRIHQTPVEIITGLNDYYPVEPVDPGLPEHRHSAPPVETLPQPASCDVRCQYLRIPAPIRWTIRIVFNLWHQ